LEYDSCSLGISVMKSNHIEGIVQGNGKVNAEQVITISVNLDKEKTPAGIICSSNNGLQRKYIFCKNN